MADGWFVINNPQAQGIIHRSVFGGGGSVEGVEDKVLSVVILSTPRLQVQAV